MSAGFLTRDQKAARWEDLVHEWVETDLDAQKGAGKRGRRVSVNKDYDTGVWRTQWRQPLLPNADYTAVRLYDGPSGAGKLIEDGSGLQVHAERVGAMISAHNPEIADLITSTLPERLDLMSKADKGKLTGYLKEAKQGVGAFGAANRGTTIHAYFESIIKGQPLRKVPAKYEPLLASFTAAVEPYEFLDVERLVSCPEYGFAGTLDGRVRLRAGGATAKVMDHKTGKSTLEYPKGMALQLAIYANSRPVDPYTGEQIEFEVPTDTDEALLMHAVADGDEVLLIPVDIKTAWEMAADAARKARDWQKYPAERLLGTPITVRPSATAVLHRDWTDEVRTALDEDQLRSIWSKADLAGDLTSDLQAAILGRREDIVRVNAA
jgi:hypothetical protein